MRIPIGFVGSVLGATIAFYLAIITLVTLPAEGAPRWFMVAGVTALSLIAGLIINSGSIQDFRKVSRDHRETSNLYNTLMNRVSPVLYGGIEDVFLRWKTSLKPDRNLNFTAAVVSGDFVKTVSSTLSPGHPVRSNTTKIGERLRGYFAEAKIAGFTPASVSVNSANRPAFDRFGRQIGELPVSPNPTTSDKWIYARPVFERSTTTPWSDRMVGILTIHSAADDADSFFKTEEFHDMVDAVATEVSPYLDAIQVLMGEEK